MPPGTHDWPLMILVALTLAAFVFALDAAGAVIWPWW